MYTFTVNDNTNIPILSSENAVFALQDYFLLPGFHTIRVKNLAAGRALIQALVPTLCPVFYGAYVSVTAMAPSISLTQLYQELEYIGAERDSALLQEHLLTAFYYDFLVIEETAPLVATDWFVSFKEALQALGIMSTLSVPVFTYEEV